MAKKLTRLDDAFGYIRHITDPGADAFQRDVLHEIRDNRKQCGVVVDVISDSGVEGSTDNENDAIGLPISFATSTTYHSSVAAVEYYDIPDPMCSDAFTQTNTAAELWERKPGFEVGCQTDGPAVLSGTSELIDTATQEVMRTLLDDVSRRAASLELLCRGSCCYPAGEQDSISTCGSLHDDIDGSGFEDQCYELVAKCQDAYDTFTQGVLHLDSYGLLGSPAAITGCLIIPLGEDDPFFDSDVDIRAPPVSGEPDPGWKEVQSKHKGKKEKKVKMNRA